MTKSSLATNLHILTLLTIYDDRWNNSTDIAGSININPVMVRKELKRLREANLIISKEGKFGGVRLARQPEDINLSDIFDALKKSDHIFELRTESPDPSCVVGGQINTQLNELFTTIDNAILDELRNVSLKEFADRF